MNITGIQGVVWKEQKTLDSTSPTTVRLLITNVIQGLIGQILPWAKGFSEWLCYLYVRNSISIWDYDDIRGLSQASRPLFWLEPIATYIHPLLKKNWELVTTNIPPLVESSILNTRCKWLSFSVYFFLICRLFCFNLLPHFIFRYQPFTDCSN